MIKPNDKKNYLISGIFISILLSVAMVTIFMLNKENALFSRRVYIKTEVKNAQNLKEGAAIQLNGIKIGSISSIEFKTVDTLIINLGINSNYRMWVKKDAQIAFKTQGVLGDKFLEISGGTATAPSVDDGDLLVTNEKNQIEHIITRSEDLMVVAGSILTKFDKILSSVENNRLEKILTNLENLTANTNKVMSSLNDKNITQSVNNFRQSSESMSRITKQIQDGPGTLHALIYDQGLHEDLRTLVGGANRSKVLKYFIRESIKKGE
ncbi:MAG: MlaD family protein [Bacteriovorax sp.]|jgi:phospholipid/cholesterol/gamma-HCH transport system substrate-binding protein